MARADAYVCPGRYFFGARCERADPAAVFEALLVRRSRSTFEAAFAAFGEVFRWPAIYLLSSLVGPQSRRRLA
jgi:hypothetical protein